MARLRPGKPSASMIVAVIALFVAMGGSSYAAITLGKNSVGSKQLKKNAVTASKIKAKAVTTSKIATHAVTASKINTAGLTVPNAGHASSSDAVNGSSITTFSTPLTPSTSSTFFSGDGLTLTAVCNSSTQIGINAQSSDPNAELNWFGDLSGTVTQNTYDGTGTSSITVLSPGSNEGSLDIEYGSSSGHSVTAALGFDYDNAYGSASNSHCGIWGKVISG